MKLDKVLATLYRSKQAQARGDAEEARRLLDRLIEKAPKTLEVWFALGEFHGTRGEHAAAEAAFRKALAINPKVAQAHFNLGLALRHQGRREPAMECFLQAIRYRPAYPEAYLNIGELLLELDKYVDAEEALNVLLRMVNDARVWVLAGIAAQGQQAYERARAYYERALALGERSYTLHLNLGSACYVLKDYAGALEQSRLALALRPDCDVARQNIAAACLQLGDTAAAVEHYEASGRESAISSLLYTSNYSEPYDPAAVFARHREWGERAVAFARRLPLPARERDPERRLRVGYVSGDFKQHAVAFFVEPLLAHHDAQAVEVCAYSDTLDADATTARIASACSRFRDVSSFSDEALADLLREDAIDILVDLGGHTGRRARMFAERIAAVQVNYLGYPTTSGLSTMDYRITDGVLDPPGASERYHTEALLRLDPVFASYAPPQLAIDPGPLPAAASGALTFGSVNKLYKLGARTLRLWAGVMEALPSARLVIVGNALSTPAGRDHFDAALREAGLPRERLELMPGLPLDDYLALHRRIDVLLDCMPWNGHTTALHALWMGVPTLTMAGSHHAGRFGLATLGQLGLADEFVAADDADFVAKARRLAGALPRLAELRAELRPRLLASPLCDHAAHARRMEAAYRAMWRRWLEANPS